MQESTFGFEEGTLEEGISLSITINGYVIISINAKEGILEEWCVVVTDVKVCIQVGQDLGKKEGMHIVVIILADVSSLGQLEDVGEACRRVGGENGKHFRFLRRHDEGPEVGRKGSGLEMRQILRAVVKKKNRSVLIDLADVVWILELRLSLEEFGMRHSIMECECW